MFIAALPEYFTTVEKFTPLIAILALAIGFIAGRVSAKGAPGRKRNSRSGGRGGSMLRSPRTSGLVEIYVGNMSYDMDEKGMRKMFEKYGTVASSRTIENRRSGKSKGYGFVEMPNRAEAEAAVKALNGKDVMGRKLRVNEARNKQRDDD